MCLLLRISIKFIDFGVETRLKRFTACALAKNSTNASVSSGGQHVLGASKQRVARIEIMSFEIFIKYKSEAGAKEAGKLRLEGKDYIVQDGDVMHFRFNV